MSRGHYRTDQLGMNLNRVYIDPSFNYHPSIYAAKSVVVFHHIMNRSSKNTDGLKFDGIFELEYDMKNGIDRDDIEDNGKNEKNVFEKVGSNINSNFIDDDVDNEFDVDNASLIENAILSDLNEYVRTPRSFLLQSSLSAKQNHDRESKFLYSYINDEGLNKNMDNLSISQHRNVNNYSNGSLHLQQNGNPNSKIPKTNSNLNSAKSTRVILSPINKLVGNTNGIVDNENFVQTNFTEKSDFIDQNDNTNDYVDEINFLNNNSNNANINFGSLCGLKKSIDGNNGKKSNHENYIGNENSDDDDDNNDFFKINDGKNSPHLNDPRLLLVNPLCSGIAFYVDLHGHAAKRGNMSNYKHN